MRVARHYPEYKETEFAWIGQIPVHWETKPVWMMFHLGRGRVISNEEIGDNPGQYPVYSSQTENDGIMGYIDTYDFDGDYITWTTDGAKAGTVFHRTGKFNCTNVCGTLSPSSRGVNLKFFSHALNTITSRFVRHDINPKLMNNVMAKIRVQVPPRTEQTQIVNFLDHKTSQIDKLIRAKERKIELLGEYRASLITQAVTKGLDPNVEMKPSGVEWVGEIPKHWKIARMKHLATLVTEKSMPAPDAIKISPENVESKTGRVLASFSAYDSVGVKFQAGDVLFNKLRVYLNKVVFAEWSGYSLGEMIVIRPSILDAGKHIFYVMLSCRFIEHCNSISYGVKMPRTSVDDIMNVKIPLISCQEQAQIADYLDDKTKQIDELRANEENNIKLLKEYRQSLISEVVTGKIGVRGEV